MHERKPNSDRAFCISSSEALLSTGACPAIVESGTGLFWSIYCIYSQLFPPYSQHFSQTSQNPTWGHSDAFREHFPASMRQALPMAAASGPGVVRGVEWLQCRAPDEVIYVLTAPVRRFCRPQRPGRRHRAYLEGRTEAGAALHARRTASSPNVKCSKPHLVPKHAPPGV